MIQLFLFAQEKVQNCTEASNSNGCLTNLPQVAGDGDQIKNLLAVVFALAAAIALISLMIAAINFVTAATDHDKIARSRRAIIFSLFGLVIALSAETIVLTLIGRL